MLPLYVAYFAGGANEGGDGQKSTTLRTLGCAAGFVLGFGLVFVLLGAASGTIGSLVVAHRRALDVVCGTVVAVLGLNYLGVLHVGALDRTVRLQTSVRPRGIASSVAFGIVFAVGWSPCVGTFLSAALGLAASSGSALHGVGLLVCYSLGLGLPFVLSAILLDQLEAALGWVRQRQELIDRVCGVVLVAMGLFMAAGVLGRLMSTLAVPLA